jgi:hypothetical protein
MLLITSESFGSLAMPSPSAGCQYLTLNCQGPLPCRQGVDAACSKCCPLPVLSNLKTLNF